MCIRDRVSTQSTWGYLLIKSLRELLLFWKMMDLAPKNEAVYNFVYESLKFVGDVKIENQVQAYDMDNVQFLIKYSDEKGNLSFSARCWSFKEIFAISGQKMLEDYYPDFTMNKTPELGYDFTMAFALNQLPEVPRKKDNETKEEKAQRKGLQDDREKAAAKVAERLAAFKRNFFASPFERIFELGIKKQIKPVDKCEFSTHKNERIFIIPSNDQVAVFYALNFEEVTDRTLADLILNELEEAKKHVKNAFSVNKSVEGKTPEILTKEFPKSEFLQRKYLNGFISLSLFPTHFAVAEMAATQLQGFRNYMHYHIHAIKTYMHSRIRNKVKFFQNTLVQTKYELEGVKLYRGLKGKNLQVGETEEEAKLQDIIERKQNQGGFLCSLALGFLCCRVQARKNENYFNHYAIYDEPSLTNISVDLVIHKS
eukprot:TRINITY_DN14033_c0_g2_i3.p1 TRINITY_DN14033_c0_g2~~TRINITY_DN14033_c0_g2_i3.p1  ORF type:complete len:426 (+),score=88.53 TRINITY_DN14033_c0_g2_i3:64-1341(+)